MTDEELRKLHLPCLLQRKNTGLVVRVDNIIDNTTGIGIVKYRGASAHNVGKLGKEWNLCSFSMMDDNNLYEEQ